MLAERAPERSRKSLWFLEPPFCFPSKFSRGDRAECGLGLGLGLGHGLCWEEEDSRLGLVCTNTLEEMGLEMTGDAHAEELR